MSLPSPRLIVRSLAACALVFAAGEPRPAAAQDAPAPAGSISMAGAAAGATGDARPTAVATHPVAARNLARGEVLTAADIRYVAAPEGEAPAEGRIELVGWRTRRVIDEGESLREPAVSPPQLVKAGETVQALYRGKSIVLRVTGTAAGSGAMGERVLVRVDARRRLEGVVIGPALVELDTNESR